MRGISTFVNTLIVVAAKIYGHIRGRPLLRAEWSLREGSLIISQLNSIHCNVIPDQKTTKLNLHIQVVLIQGLKDQVGAGVLKNT